MNIIDKKYRLVPFALLLGAILIPFAGCSDDEESVTAPMISTSTIRVPADHLTIQNALNAAESGDTILVSDGIYTDSGNIDISILRKSVTIMSENGPAKTIIDCNGTPEEPHRAFIIQESESSSTVIDGFTIQGGFASSGAAVYCKSSSPTFRNCIFRKNESTVSGGAIRCKDSSPSFINCTFVSNAAQVGGAIFGLASSSPHLERCIIAFSNPGESIATADGSSQPSLSCCNIFGNVGGDWVRSIGDQANTAGNISLNPQFCDAVNGNLALKSISPCAPKNNSCQLLIGALPVECN